jgi:hypothetical protein
MVCLTVCPALLLQLKRLPQDPLDPQMLLQLGRLEGAINALRGGPIAPAMLQHFIPLGLLPMLHERLLSLGTTSASPSPSQGSASTQMSAVVAALATDAPSPSGAAGSLTTTLPETVCRAMAHIGRVLTMSMWLYNTERDTTDAISEQLLSAFMDQLMSNAEALEVLVHCGLSTEVQGAAAGGSRTAQDVMTEVCVMFRTSAAVLSFSSTGIAGDSRSGLAEKQLWAFLNLEDTLPYLELLCTPLPHGEPHV